jgi:hypothetical protein
VPPHRNERSISPRKSTVNYISTVPTGVIPFLVDSRKAGSATAEDELRRLVWMSRTEMIRHSPPGSLVNLLSFPKNFGGGFRYHDHVTVNNVKSMLEKYRSAKGIST